MNIENLEVKFAEISQELGVSPEHQAQILEFLEPLRNADKEAVRAHYAHSLRVGMKAKEIADFTHHDPKPLFFAGTLHDVGKCQIPPEILGKVRDWTQADALVMEQHVLAGYETLRGTFDLSAEIMLWHHRFQKNGYPEVLPEHLHPYSDSTKVLIVEYGRLLALADVYDALHRLNEKFGGKISGARIRELMFELNPDRTILIDRLYQTGILTV